MAEIETVLIAGPTASGKSALAVALAQRLGGAVVNADAMQVYRELRILSARPDTAEMAGVAHQLFGHVSAWEPYSVARWLADARSAIAALHRAGRVAVVTGGTGLYFKALTEGLTLAPSSTTAVKLESRARRENLGLAAFYQELLQLDPKAARLNVGDTQRVLRAWEIATLRQADQPPMPAPDEAMPLGKARRIVLELDRDELYRRIERRFDAMMEAGALDEARAFWDLRPDPESPAAKALGLPHLHRFLNGAVSLETAVSEAKRDSRRYAKRQGTWFRHQAPDWRRLDVTSQPLDATIRSILETEPAF